MRQHYCVWTGTYSFQQELELILEYLKDQIDLLLYKLLETERKIWC